MQIKKRKRAVTRYQKPTASAMLRIASAQNWVRSKKLKLTTADQEVVKDFKLYEYHADKYTYNSENVLPGHDAQPLEREITPEEVNLMKLQYEANVNNGGELVKTTG